jgi:hypothetical protein
MEHISRQKMIRSRSVSSFGNSSVMTGDSLQMALEGQWDENISIDEIHQGIMSYLANKLEDLKSKYIQLKFADRNKQERVMKKVVSARIRYQKYINVTKDVLRNCNEFLRVRKDTPGSRIAFIRNVQEYLSQAKEFVKMDITLKKISPTLLNHIQPSTHDTPEMYSRKRDMRKAMSMVLQNDKNCLTTNGLGKMFRSRYAQQNRFIHHKFPDIWIQYFPVVLRNALKGVTSSERRWLITIIYIFSKHCSSNYIQQGYCSSCLFPIIQQRTQGVVAGKLYCLSCKKEIDWTYFMNPRTICLIFSGFHNEEIEESKQRVIDSVLEDKHNPHDETSEPLFEEILQQYINVRMDFEDSIPKPILQTVELPVEERVQQVVEPEPSINVNIEIDKFNKMIHAEDTMYPDEYSIPSFSTVIVHVMETMNKIYGKESIIDLKLAKESYATFRSEILSFEGKNQTQVPRGLIPKIERYVCHYYKLAGKDEIKKLPLTEKGDRTGTSRKMIYDALSDLSLTKYSHMVSKISHKLWGSQLPNMKDHYLEILHDCVLQREVFNRLSSTYGRKTNIGQKVILMYISKRYGYKWDEDDFRVSFSQNTLTKHLEILKEIFSIIDHS